MPAPTHHVIPQPIGHATQTPLPNGTPTGPIPPEATAHAPQLVGGGQGAPALPLVLLILAVAIASLWALRLASRYSPPREARGPSAPREPWAPGAVYTYRGARLLLRRAFLTARALLEQGLGRPLASLTPREVAEETGDPGALEAAEEYSRAMYSRAVPGPREAERIAAKLLEAAERWRRGGSQYSS